jgi:hypothetical protein
MNNSSLYETKNNGTRKLYRCGECQQVFSETKGTFLEGLKKPISLIINVLKSRSEGMGFNAACRVFEISGSSRVLVEPLKPGGDSKSNPLIHR